jgi:hypothetical protein
MPGSVSADRPARTKTIRATSGFPDWRIPALWGGSRSRCRHFRLDQLARGQDQLGVAEPHQGAAISAYDGTRLDVFSAKVLFVSEGYFFFFLPVFFFAFFAFLAILPSAIPKLVQCKSTSTCIRSRVHHNFKIDTARFEQGKRGSHRNALRARDLIMPHRCDACMDTARLALAPDDHRR